VSERVVGHGKEAYEADMKDREDNWKADKQRIDEAKRKAAEAGYSLELSNREKPANTEE
jgi:hypothetical protein